MKRTLNKLLDILFPPREAQLILREYSRKTALLNDGCHEGIFYCANYTHPVIHAAIIENKFYNNQSAQDILSSIVSAWVDSKQLQDVYFVPIPLGTEREKSRGHNQVLSVLQRSTHLHQKFLLSRTKETIPQASLNKQQRQRNVKNIFTCDSKYLTALAGSTIILLDDVVTTGATLNEARATLTPHLPPDTKLICLAMAH